MRALFFSNISKFLSIGVATSIALGGCSGMDFSISENVDGNWLKSGSVSIARPAPQSNVGGEHNIFAFMPVPSENREISNLGDTTSDNYYLYINKKMGQLSLHKGGTELYNVRASISNSVTPGIYEVILKQENPLWYAPNDYFVSRHIEIPAEGSAERFRKGALGDMAIFLSPDIAIYSGPVIEPSISGVSMGIEEMSNLFSNLALGTTVVVR